MIANDFGCRVVYPELTDKESPLFVGIECEIESVRNHGLASSIGFQIEHDGSLRNNGHEYISPPSPIDHTVEMFSKLHTTLTLDDDPFTTRTSIHVHANVCNLTQDQVRNIILLYALYEEAFFLMVDSVRRDNIHCVPLTETYLPSLYRENLSRLCERWHKYTALNIRPITSQGTIEFRHMHGHDDHQLLSEWLRSINNLIEKAKTTKLTVSNMNKEFIEQTFKDIFKDTRIGARWTLVHGKMRNSIIDVKLAVI